MGVCVWKSGSFWGGRAPGALQSCQHHLRRTGRLLGKKSFALAIGTAADANCWKPPTEGRLAQQPIPRTGPPRTPPFLPHLQHRFALVDAGGADEQRAALLPAALHHAHHLQVLVLGGGVGGGGMFAGGQFLGSQHHWGRLGGIWFANAWVLRGLFQTWCQGRHLQPSLESESPLPPPKNMPAGPSLQRNPKHT